MVTLIKLSTGSNLCTVVYTQVPVLESKAVLLIFSVGRL